MKTLGRVLPPKPKFTLPNRYFFKLTFLQRMKILFCGHNFKINVTIYASHNPGPDTFIDTKMVVTSELPPENPLTPEPEPIS